MTLLNEKMAADPNGASAMPSAFVREEVAAFLQRGAYGWSEADCFPAWYLHHRYGLAASDAIAQCAEGAGGVRRNNDHGLDAFCLIRPNGQPQTLVIIQAKYSESFSVIGGAFRDLERALPRIAEALTGAPSAAVRENRVLVSLRQALLRLSDEERKALRLRLEVVHLSAADELVIRANTRRGFDDLRQALADDPVLENWLAEIDLVGPAKMGGAIPSLAAPPQIWHRLELVANPLTVQVDGRAVTMYSGIGRLEDLVELYNERRSDLFAKNVRYFLTTKHNEERGPSGKIKEALRSMCVKGKAGATTSPELFAFHHNGITIFARDVQKDDNGTIRKIRDPYVLNGCQTVRSAYDFRYDARISQRIDGERWSRVSVPVRVITTQQESLIRQITISNNRQNQIPASALRANDDVQLDLEKRLRHAGIFYERQRGAFDELLRSNSARLDEFARTNGRAVNIDDLARSLAAVSGDFDLAHNPSHIFEGDAAYDRVFSADHLRSTRLLVLIQNLHDVLPVVLKGDLGLAQSNPKAPRKSRLAYYTMCLLVRYLAKNSQDNWAALYGGELLGRSKDFREEVTLQLGNYRSKIKQALKERFLSLEETNANTLKDAFRKAAWDVRLGDAVDPFATFADLDMCGIPEGE